MATRARLVASLATVILLVTACATPEVTDPGAPAPTDETPQDPATDDPAIDAPVTGDPTSVPGETGSAAPPAGGTCLEGATECADVPGATPPGPPDDVEPTMVEARDDLVEVRPVPWVEVAPDDDQAVLTVTWWGGNEDCHGLDHVAVEEDAEVVTVTVHTGREPDVQVCTQEAVLKATTVDLSEPLGPRSILDGAEEA